MTGIIPYGFNHVNNDKSLCLGIEAEIKIIIFKNTGDLIYWFDKFVINYLYAAMYFKRFNDVPFGERSHGIEGKIEFYREFLKEKNIAKIYYMLTYVQSNEIVGHRVCPCGSGRRIRNCHMKELLSIKEINNINDMIEIERAYMGTKEKFFIYPFTNEEINKIMKSFLEI